MGASGNPARRNATATRARVEGLIKELELALSPALHQASVELALGSATSWVPAEDGACLPGVPAERLVMNHDEIIARAVMLVLADTPLGMPRRMGLAPDEFPAFLTALASGMWHECGYSLAFDDLGVPQHIETYDCSPDPVILRMGN